MTKIGLCMIVKNELANLPRCLDSVAPHISCWVIGDTGSTDGTQNFIRDYFAKRGIPGELHSFPFHNFEQARNAALDHAYASALDYDYLLHCDADMEFMVGGAGLPDKLDATAYQLLQRTSGNMSYRNTRLVRREAGARYRGVTHEYLDAQGKEEPLDAAWFEDHASGANRVDKFERDIRLLQSALETETDRLLVSRYTFYLAQSYRDANQPEPALAAYMKRATLGYWNEEIFESLTEAGKLMERLGRPDAEVLGTYLKAFEHSPGRIESLHAAVKFCNWRRMPSAGHLIGKQGIDAPRPVSGLFIQDWIYDYGLLDEFAIAAYWSGHYQDSINACSRLLDGGKLPAVHRARVKQNAQYAWEKLRPA